MAFQIVPMKVSPKGDVVFNLGHATLTFAATMHNQSQELGRFLNHNAAVLLDVVSDDTANVRLTFQAEVVRFRDPKLNRR
jgi:hypothetical protein